ncbi:MAG: prephenate dehydrogenase [Chloroflexota bacterium]|nr:prephenate dehydrogenase [Chloroflexota bacterium]
MADPAGADDRLGEATVAIVGLGMMGGSLAVALRGAASTARHCKQVIGIVRHADTLPLARHYVDQATTDLVAVAAADIVVLATPARTILRLLPQVAALLRPGTLLTDLGSSKAEIVRVMSTLPQGILTIGGHPMCGKESGGLAAADARLYVGAPFVLCPVPGQPDAAIVQATALAQAVGARPRVLDAARHDQAVAAISHLPYAMAVATVLAAEAQAAASGDLLWQLAAGGFRDTTRVAGGEIAMWTDILLTNRAAVLTQLAQAGVALAALTTAVAQEDEAGLTALLTSAQQRRRGMFQRRAEGM